MADDIGVFIEGDRALQLKFDTFPQRAHDLLRDQAIRPDIEELAAHVRLGVPHRTGKLAGEIVSSVQDSENRIVGKVTVSAEFAKAAALEYGGTGKPFQVKAHAARLTHLWGRAVATPMLVDVSAHSRAIHTPALRFMRGPFESMQEKIEADMRAALDEAAAE